MRTGIALAAMALLLASCAAQVSGPPESAATDQLVLRTSSALQVWDAKGDLVRSLGRAVASPDDPESAFQQCRSGWQGPAI